MSHVGRKMPDIEAVAKLVEEQYRQLGFIAFVTSASIDSKAPGTINITMSLCRVQEFVKIDCVLPPEGQNDTSTG